jgi:hypothetical protein
LLKGSYLMSNLNERKRRCSAGYVAVALIAGVLVGWPLLLPGGTANADCWPLVRCPNGDSDTAALVSSIDVVWEGGTTYKIVFNRPSGVDANGSACGQGGAVITNVVDSSATSCGSETPSGYSVILDSSGCASGSLTVSYRVRAYLAPTGSNNPGKVNGSFTLNPSDFTVIDQRINGYAPVPGC